MAKSKHTPVELTPSAKRKAQKAGILKTTGSGAARKAGESVVRRDTASSRARAAADKALGITRR